MIPEQKEFERQRNIERCANLSEEQKMQRTQCQSKQRLNMMLKNFIGEQTIVVHIGVHINTL